MKLRNTLLGSTLLVAAFGSSALSLGRARGAVVLGQALDLAVDVRLDSADDSASNCFEAEVYHAETRVDPSRVRVILVAGSQTQDAVVRVRSTVPVDEPVVGVVLRSLCSQKTSRRYDFLTDFPVETRSAAVPTIIAAAVSAPPATAVTPAPDGPAPAPLARAPRPAPVRSTQNPANVPQAKAAPKVEAAPKPVVAKETPPAPKPVVKAEAPDNKPHLKLEAAETPDERVVQLKPATEMVVAPEENPQKRAEAAAAWRELNHLPSDNPEQKQRLLSLEAESKALKALLAKNESDFKLRLEKLENSRSDEGLVYTLAGLLAAAVAAAGFFWSRARRPAATAGGTDWAHHGELSAEEAEQLARPSRAAPLTVQPPPNTLPGANQDTEVDESLAADLRRLNAMTATPPAAPAPRAPAARARVTPEPVRGQHTEDFLDVQQHAEFFVSLGQYDQAIEVLRKNIDENIEVNPLAYLELLKIFHALGRKSEFNHQRDAFNRIFNGHVPAFESYVDEGRTLEAYPAVLRSIETLWESPRVLDFIESCLFRDPAAAPIKPFDLAAYRELLLLYAMAKGTVRKGAPLGVDGVPAERGGRVSGRQPLEPGLKSSALDDGAVAHEATFTQPMLLMPESAVASLDDVPDDSVVAPVEPSPVDLELDLDLDLDFSNSELASMDKPLGADTQEPKESGLSALDFELDDAPEHAPTVPPPSTPAPVPNSNLLEFDLFDPQVEAKIAPKSK